MSCHDCYSIPKTSSYRPKSLPSKPSSSLPSGVPRRSEQQFMFVDYEKAILENRDPHKLDVDNAIECHQKSYSQCVFYYQARWTLPSLPSGSLLPGLQCMLSVSGTLGSRPLHVVCVCVCVSPRYRGKFQSGRANARRDKHSPDKSV